MSDVRCAGSGSGDAMRKFSAALAVVCLGAVLAGCGGGDDEEATAQQNPSTNPPANAPSGNQAPTISGSPPAQALQGQQYIFTPNASDANGDALTFSVANMPEWATFTASNGRLSGAPSAAQVGTYSNIVISVSDGTTTIDLPAFSITVVATATGSATLTWNPPTQNTDGSALTNLAGYKLYWGTSPGNYSNSATISNPGLATYVVDQLTPATWYFALTAVNNGGVESTFSNEASKQVL